MDPIDGIKSVKKEEQSLFINDLDTSRTQDNETIEAYQKIKRGI